MEQWVYDREWDYPCVKKELWLCTKENCIYCLRCKKMNIGSEQAAHELLELAHKLDRENKEKDIIIENIRNLLNPTAKPFKFTFT